MRTFKDIKIKDEDGNKYLLTSTMMEECTRYKNKYALYRGGLARAVRHPIENFTEVTGHLIYTPKNKVSGMTWSFFISRGFPGPGLKYSIGCRKFGVAATEKIRQWAVSF